MKIKNFIGALLGVGLVALGFTEAASGQTVIQSGAPVVVGSAPACVITVYVAAPGRNCEPCNRLKRRVYQTDRNGCPRVEFKNASDSDAVPQLSWTGHDDLAYGENKMNQALVDCAKICSNAAPPSNPQTGGGGAQPPVVSGPSKPKPLQCTGDAKIPCGDSHCCMYACNHQEAKCVKCPGYLECSKNPCPEGKVCANPLDEKGCPQSRVCTDPTKPPASPNNEGSTENCVDGVCYPPNSEEPKQADPKPKEPEPADQGCYEGRCDEYPHSPKTDPTPPPQPTAGRCSTAPLTQECSTSDSWTCCRPEERCGRDSRGFATCLPGGLLPRESLGN